MVIYIYMCFPFVCCLFGCMSILLAYLFLFHVPNQLKKKQPTRSMRKSTPLSLPRLEKTTTEQLAHQCKRFNPSRTPRPIGSMGSTVYLGYSFGYFYLDVKRETNKSHPHMEQENRNPMVEETSTNKKKHIQQKKHKTEIGGAFLVRICSFGVSAC